MVEIEQEKVESILRRYTDEYVSAHALPDYSGNCVHTTRCSAIRFIGLELGIISEADISNACKRGDARLKTIQKRKEQSHGSP